MGTAAFLVITALAGLTGLLTGFSFRKGIPLLWRFVGVGVIGIWFALIGLCAGIYNSDARDYQQLWFWLHRIGGGFLMALCFLGLYVIWGAILLGAQSFLNRLLRRGKP